MKLSLLIEKAIEHCGTQEALAQKAGLSQAGVSWLLTKADRVSAETAIALEKATEGKITRHDLRPDLFGGAA